MSVPFFAKALFEYEAVEESELSVTAGDFLTVEEVNESGWCLVRGHSTATAIVQARARGNAATDARQERGEAVGRMLNATPRAATAAEADFKRLTVGSDSFFDLSCTVSSLLSRLARAI